MTETEKTLGATEAIEAIGAIVILVLLFIVVFLVVGIVDAIISEKKCLEIGYPDYRAGYCVKRIDGTDHMCQLSECLKESNNEKGDNDQSIAGNAIGDDIHVYPHICYYVTGFQRRYCYYL